MKNKYLLVVAGLLFLVSSCSINQFAVRIVADALTSPGGGSVFMTDNDPEFIASALPFALKTFESLLQSDPDNIDLIEASASGFVSYANGFLQSPAELLSYEQIEEKNSLLKRASAMYRRGGDYASLGLKKLYPELYSDISNGNYYVLADMNKDAVPFLYWKAAALMGEFSIDSFNPALMIKIPGAVAFAVRALELDENYNQGAIHNLFISIFANLPESLIYRSLESDNDYSVREAFKAYYLTRGSLFGNMIVYDQALFHFDLSVKISRGSSVTPFVAISSLYINNQDIDSFKYILKKALEIDLNSNPDNMLQNIISQRKAEWLLDHIDDYFFIL